MKKSLFLIFLIALSFRCVNAQEIIKKEYYKDRYTKTQNEKRAKFVELTIREKNGTLTRQTRDIASNNVVESYNENNVQNGVWILSNGDTLNYDFDVEYGEKEYPNIVKYDITNNRLLSQVDGSFEPPVLQIYENELNKLLIKNIRYPIISLENAEQGKTVSQFIIDENGKVINYSIIQSAGKVLDKEAARVLLISKNYWMPAKIDGVPIKLLINLTTTFRLQ